ncbi:MAG: hypothetical protein KTR18_14335 [Acidiferrobacterales bacterium]|nr:hypothetical protein [Acidiferrobacterales bacterium]
MLFFDNHLKNLEPPTTLTYIFDKQSNFENDESFNDTVKVHFESSEGDRKNATIEYFTGDRKRFAPDFNAVIGNPILTVALQRDIYQMERMLNNGTSWRHFQKRLKIAFEESAEVVETDVKYNGRQVAALDIVVQPFLTDPMSKRFPAFKNKLYVFTLSEEVPGSVFRIFAQVDKNADGHSITESFTISEP